MACPLCSLVCIRILLSKCMTSCSCVYLNVFIYIYIYILKRHAYARTCESISFLYTHYSPLHSLMFMFFLSLFLFSGAWASQFLLLRLTVSTHWHYGCGLWYDYIVWKTLTLMHMNCICLCKRWFFFVLFLFIGFVYLYASMTYTCLAILPSLEGICGVRCPLISYVWNFLSRPYFFFPTRALVIAGSICPTELMRKVMIVTCDVWRVTHALSFPSIPSSEYKISSRVYVNQWIGAHLCFQASHISP